MLAHLLTALALALAIGSAFLPVLALPAMIAVLLAVVRSAGRARLIAGSLGGAATAIGLYRFTIEWAVPNVVSSGQFAAEERAVSRLREILWAEDRVRESRWADTDSDGAGEYAFLGELCGRMEPRAGVRLKMPLLRREQFHAMPGGAAPVYRSEGYAFVVYLPARGGGLVGEGQGTTDAHAAARRFVAYGWPVDRGKGGMRAFYIDQDDRICETDNTQGYSGTGKLPRPGAAVLREGTGLEAPACVEQASDGGRWRPWKNKRPRIPRN